MANANPKRPQKFKKSEIVAYSSTIAIFILSLIAASSLTDAFLHDPILKASLELTQSLSTLRLSAQLRAELASEIAAVTEIFSKLTQALAVPLVWWEAKERLVKFCRRIGPSIHDWLLWLWHELRSRLRI